MNTTPEHADGLFSKSSDMSGPGDPSEPAVSSAAPAGPTPSTSGGPERYAVTASLSRRPPPAIEPIHTAGTRRHLEDAGFAQASLPLADRRLLINGTNLQELRNGLAALVGTIMRAGSLKALAEREIARQAQADLSDAEHARLLRMGETAAAIDFGD
jgi:hypothetical protein